ncbi:TRM1 (YDR120C) [Zygosaccharomyces parabailii]|nr:TRM1 (YDR120C) [Zygosaccharomyces parabailii]CDH10717.1 probable tRNA (guanine(26)-N(2))-dimethyltransferase, mitochondrial [Zygosaccharomyces bailii ISA1307]
MLRAALQQLKSRLTGNGANLINPEDYNIVKEGRAEILFPKKDTVFYNPVQQFNRDLSVCCIKAWDHMYGQPSKKSRRRRRKAAEEGEEPEGKRRRVDDREHEDEQENVESTPYIKILEALSATGLRAIRYAREIPHVKEVLANDLLPEAVESIRRNAEFNHVKGLVKPNTDDANVLMYRNKAQNNRYHVIDLDPYGTVTPFVDSALQTVEDGGLMLVTCTDLSVLAGNGYPEKCYALYGGVNMVSHESTHESALRLVVNLLNQSAAKYKKCVEPLLCLSIDFYVRVFVRVRTSPIDVKNLQSNTMITYHCSQCGSYHQQPLGRASDKTTKKNKTIRKYSVAQGPPVDTKCKFCGGTYHLAGPMYAGPLHNAEFIDQVLKINAQHDDHTYGTRRRIEGMLTLAKSELSDSPFYFSPNHLSSILKLQVPPLKKIVAGLGSLGYSCSLTHAQPSSLKTNAPWEAIWYVVSQSDSDKGKLARMKEGTVGHRILSRMNDWMADYNFSKLSFEPNEQSGQLESLRKLKIVRYQENPTKNWGPKARPNSS